MKIETTFDLFVEESPYPGLYRTVKRAIRLSYEGDDPIRGVGRLQAVLGRAWAVAEEIAALDATSTSLRLGVRADASQRAARNAREAVVDAWRDVFDGGDDDVEVFVAADPA